MKNRTLLISKVVFFALASVAGSKNSSAQTPAPANEAAIDALVIANRVLASELIGFLDTAGHVRARSPTNPSHFFFVALGGSGND